MNRKTARVIGRCIRWIARLCSVPLIYFLCAGIVGTFGHGGHVPSNEIVDFIFFPLGVTVGMILAWRWELPGSVVILGGMAGMYFVFFLKRGEWAPGPLSLFVVPGVLFLVSRWLNGPRHKRSHSTPLPGLGAPE